MSRAVMGAGKLFHHHQKPKHRRRNSENTKGGDAKSSAQPSSAGPGGVRVFGIPLDDVVRKRPSPAIPSVPDVIEQCMAVVTRAGISLEGIFRVSGNAGDVAELQRRVENEPPFSFVKAHVAPHNAATLLKQFLRELPEPVLTLDRYDKWIEIADLSPGPEMNLQIKLLFETLPQSNQALLRALFPFAQLVVGNSMLNKMHVSNLAKVIGPNLLWQKSDNSAGGDPMAYLMLSNKINDLTEQMFVNWKEIVPSAAKPSPVQCVAKIFGHAKSCAGVVWAKAGTGEVWSFDSTGMVRIWNIEKRKFVEQFDTGQGRLFDMRAIGDNHICSTSGGGLKVWDAETHRELANIPGFFYGVHSVGSDIWLGGEQKIDVYDRASLSKVREFSGGLDRGCVVTCLATAFDGKVWGGAVDAVVRVWEPESGKLLAELHGHSKKVSCLATVGDQVWSAEGSILVWDASSKKQVAELQGHEGTIHSIEAIGPQFIWSSAWDGVMIIWDRATLAVHARVENFAEDAVSRVISVSNPGTFETEAWASSWDQSVLVFTLDDGHQSDASALDLQPLEPVGTLEARHLAVEARRKQLSDVKRSLEKRKAKADVKRAELDRLQQMRTL